MGRLSDLLDALEALEKVGEVEGVADVRYRLFAKVGEFVYETSKSNPEGLFSDTSKAPLPQVQVTRKKCRCGCGRELELNAWRGLYRTCREACNSWCRENGLNSRSREGFDAWAAAGFPVPEVEPQKPTGGRRTRRKLEWAAYAELPQADEKHRAIAAYIASGKSYDEAAANFQLSRARISQIGDKLWSLHTGEAPRNANNNRGRKRRVVIDSSEEEQSPVYHAS